eukprot:PhF_6_TR37883/c0_g1_i1/m.56522
MSEEKVTTVWDHFDNGNYNRIISAVAENSVLSSVSPEQRHMYNLAQTALSLPKVIQRRTEVNDIGIPTLKWCQEFVEKRMIPGHTHIDQGFDVLGPAASLGPHFHGREHRTGVYHGLTETAHPYPLTQTHKAILYHKHQAYYAGCCTCNLGVETHPEARFGFGYSPDLYSVGSVASWDVPARSVEEGKLITQPCPNADMYYMKPGGVSPVTHTILRRGLQRLSEKLGAQLLPQYENIIDPNAVVVDIPTTSSTRPQEWLATPVRIEELAPVYHGWGLQRGTRLSNDCIRHVMSYLPGVNLRHVRHRARIEGPIPRVDPAQHGAIYAGLEDVFNAALPMLAKLCRPSLYLPGDLQVVFKAQRILLQEEGEEYEGVWHKDGKNEHVVAVVLYYTKISGFEGGDLEFVDSEPVVSEVWLGGDCDPSKFTSDTIKTKLTQEMVRCRVPTQEGALYVFSNYQLVHRVLRMKALAGGKGVREFVAMFVIDQTRPSPSTYQVEKLKSEGKIEEGLAPQMKLLAEQLDPVGHFGLGKEHVYSTGNGSVSLLGFIMEQYNAVSIQDLVECYSNPDMMPGAAVAEYLNRCPPLGRGLSWVADVEPNLEEFYKPEEVEESDEEEDEEVTE